jgi:hypothetical protein
MLHAERKITQKAHSNSFEGLLAASIIYLPRACTIEEAKYTRISGLPFSRQAMTLQN